MAKKNQETEVEVNLEGQSPEAGNANPETQEPAGNGEGGAATEQPAAPAPKAPAAPAAQAKVSTGNKMVKVHSLEDIDCIVAGQPYKYPKGREFQVPMDVAFILANAKKVYRV